MSEINYLDFINFPMTKKAMVIADAAHKGQKRRKSGEDYIWHPLRVAESIFKKYMAVVAAVTKTINNSQETLDSFLAIAIMHDVFEDTIVKEENIKEDFSKFIINGIKTLSRCEGENYLNFILRVKYTPYFIIKMADIEDNMSDLDEGSLKDKYRLAYFILNS